MHAFNRSMIHSFCLVSKGPGNTKVAKSTAVPPGPPVYLDLVYIPNHSNSKNVDVEFFKRVRSSYYVVSGNDAAAEEPSRAVLDSLLEGKAQWESNMQVSSSLLSQPGNLTLLSYEKLEHLWSGWRLPENGAPRLGTLFHWWHVKHRAALHSAAPTSLALQTSSWFLKQLRTGLQGQLAVSYFYYTICMIWVWQCCSFK